MRYQRYNLKMGYKRRTKMRSKLMQHIRKVVPKQNHIPSPTPQPQWRSHTAVTTQELISLYQQSQLIPTLSHPPFDPLTAFMPETSVTYLQRLYRLCPPPLFGCAPHHFHWLGLSVLFFLGLCLFLFVSFSLSLSLSLSLP